MIKRLAVLFLTLLPVVACEAQRGNSFYVDQFKGATVGEKTIAAQKACNPNTNVPCVLIFDPTLAVYPVGNMPAKCSQCFWMDYTGKFGGLGLPVASAGARWLQGTLDPTPANGQWYWNTASNDLFSYNDATGKWSLLGNLDTSGGYSGSGDPDPANCDMMGKLYIDTAGDKTVSVCGNMPELSWTVQVHLYGYTGTADPTVVTGNRGDFYMNTTSGNVFNYDGAAWAKLGHLVKD